ncbi:hypothetical protein SUGI_0737370 [Cryptomeria japonica]|nr:hypothetical protein SUGI_0737370 [Cryptomeria japonica]
MACESDGGSDARVLVDAGDVEEDEDSNGSGDIEAREDTLALQFLCSVVDTGKSDGSWLPFGALSPECSMPCFDATPLSVGFSGLEVMGFSRSSSVIDLGNESQHLKRVVVSLTSCFVLPSGFVPSIHDVVGVLCSCVTHLGIYGVILDPVWVYFGRSQGFGRWFG